MAKNRGGGGKKKADPNAAFAKKKIKVGKQLKKTNVTDTRFAHKKVVLLEQLKTPAAGESSATVSHRGHSLDELCRQTGHFSIAVRRDAVTSKLKLHFGRSDDSRVALGLKQMLSAHPELISKHLRTIIPSVGRLIGEDVRHLVPKTAALVYKYQTDIVHNTLR